VPGKKRFAPKITCADKTTRAQQHNTHGSTAEQLLQVPCADECRCCEASRWRTGRTPTFAVSAVLVFAHGREVQTLAAASPQREVCRGLHRQARDASHVLHNRKDEALWTSGARSRSSRSCLLLHFLRQQDVQTSYSFSHIIAMPVRIATMMISMRSGNKHMIRAGIPHSP